MTQTAETYRLTKKELDILRLVAEGHTYDEVAEQIGQSRSIVQFYMSRMLRVTGLRRGTNLIALYAKAPTAFVESN